MNVCLTVWQFEYGCSSGSLLLVCLAVVDDLARKYRLYTFIYLSTCLTTPLLHLKG